MHLLIVCKKFDVFYRTFHWIGLASNWLWHEILSLALLLFVDCIGYSIFQRPCQLFFFIHRGGFQALSGVRGYQIDCHIFNGANAVIAHNVRKPTSLDRWEFIVFIIQYRHSSIYKYAFTRRNHFKISLFIRRNSDNCHARLSQFRLIVIAASNATRKPKFVFTLTI